ncbi:o-succinylbenzoate synthase [Shewanella sp. CG12_big_fil_rev_8_21_14_0_65_47_15]|uniref:o-succinylbenzoate synthase n=1 Tax=Shewanella sp. CG12_big_fil_rev_8_21_14_0_65_47_15 TaxID=1975537 RepID=UPI000CC8CAF4|nr:o-succinylbenzoate synthase [Shewanella sp. CG12_big_fil_rev_8_21_14_0_65_47_15]PIW62971.1 MAG: o-succinylbenzoate synthase [Shewanella sp. CG12_big_fil_rev_8_21_14_0_65_47_15]
MILTSLNLYQYRLPLDVLLPVGKQRIDHRAGLVLQASASVEGEHRQAEVEIAPLSGIDIDEQILVGFSRETLAQVQTALTELLPQLCGQHIDALLECAEHSPYPSLAFGLSLLHAKLMGKLDAIRPQTAVVPLIYHPTDVGKDLLDSKIAALGMDIHAVKVKVAQTSIEDELRLIYGILSTRSDLKLRLDANRGFTLEQAITFAASLPLDAIEYIEEPCQNPQDNLPFYQAIGMPYVLDESLNDPDYRFAMQNGLAALVIKPMLLGTIEKLANLIDTAQSYGVRCIISSSLESSLGISDLAHLATILTPDETPGLDTLSAFSQDLIVSSGKKHCLTLSQLEPIAQYAVDSKSQSALYAAKSEES